MHKALRTGDILENIFEFLDVKSLASVYDVCKDWRNVIDQRHLWRKCSRKLARLSNQNSVILNQHADKSESCDESKFYKRQCTKLHKFKHSFSDIEPSEQLLECSPESVNKNFNFSWEPWWWWKNKGGWIASFATDGDYLLCGVIETLQVWDLRTSKCVRILSTPRDDYVQGVDIALNCLDLCDNIAVSGSNEGVIRVWNVTTKKFTK